MIVFVYVYVCAWGVLTAQSSRGQYVLVHVIQIVRKQQVLWRGSPDPQRSRVQVESRGQKQQARIIYNAQTCERLDLLPAMQLLPQSHCYLS